MQNIPKFCFILVWFVSSPSFPFLFLRFLSFPFISFPFLSFPFPSFPFLSFCFISLRFVSFRFVFVLFYFVVLCCVVLFCVLTIKTTKATISKIYYKWTLVKSLLCNYPGKKNYRKLKTQESSTIVSTFPSFKFLIFQVPFFEWFRTNCSFC